MSWAHATKSLDGTRLGVSPWRSATLSPLWMTVVRPSLCFPYHLTMAFNTVQMMLSPAPNTLPWHRLYLACHVSCHKPHPTAPGDSSRRNCGRPDWATLASGNFNTSLHTPRACHRNSSHIPSALLITRNMLASVNNLLGLILHGPSCRDSDGFWNLASCDPPPQIFYSLIWPPIVPLHHLMASPRTC